MKKIWKKVLASMLAVVMVLTSFAIDWNSTTEAEAAEEVQENVITGDMLTDVDFTEENIYALDDKFVATEGTTDSAHKYWKNGEVGTTAETTNVALGGTVEMNSMAWITTLSWYSEGLLVNGDKESGNTYVSTEEYSSEDNTESITVTFENNTYYLLSKVAFNPNNGSYGIPKDFTVEVYNGTEWVTVAKETGYSTTGEWSQEIIPIVGNAIRLNVTKLGYAKGNTKYVLQLNELEAYGTTCSNVALNGSVSMNSMVWIKNNASWYSEDLLVDGDKTTSGNTYTTTEEYSSQSNTETITVTFSDNTYYNINEVSFSPRNGIYGIPEDFIVEVGNGTSWTKVVDVTGYTTTGDWTSIGFVPVKGNAVRITATKLGSTGSNYGLQLREFEAYGWKSTNAASGGSATITTFSEISGWAGSYDPNVNLIDGEKSGKNEFGTSKFYGDGANHNESATVTFANSAYYKIDKIVLYPAVNGSTYVGGFPKDFTVSVWNGTKWVQVATKTDYTSGITSLCIDIEPTICNAVKIDATELDISSDGSNYALQLAEVEALGEAVGLLKTKTTYDSSNATTTLLAIKDTKATDFKAEIEILNYDASVTRYGLYFGHDTYESLEGAVSVTPMLTSPAGSILASGLGGVQAGTAAFANDNYSDYVDTTGGSFNQPSYVRSNFSINDFSTSTSNISTLNVEVIDGVMKLWWSGFENAAWTVKLYEGYDGGYIALYSQGADQGGIKSFKVQELIVRGGASSDFTESDSTALDETFVASQGTNGANGTVATEGVSQYWNMGGTPTVERTNVALNGTPDLDNPYTGENLLNDGLIGGLVSTTAYSSADVSDTGVNATVTFDGYYKIDQVIFTWRYGAGAPVDFMVQVLVGGSWKTVETVTGFTTTEMTWTKDIDPIVCKGFRLHVTTLGAYEGNYWLQMREMEAYGTPITNAASGGSAEMNIPSYLVSSRPADYLYDEDPTTWTATDPRVDAQYNTEKVTLTFAQGAYYEISEISFYPYSGVYGIPENFIVEVYNGSEWVKVAGETGYTTTGTWRKNITPTVCNAMRLTATKLGKDNKGTNYALMLGEISAYGVKTNFLTTKEAYANGNTTQLTWAEKKLENFRAEIEMLDFTTGTTAYGLYFGQSNYGVVEEGVISVTPNSTVSGGILVGGTGKIDVSTAAYVDSSISSISYFNKSVSGGYVRSSYAVPNYSEGIYDNLHTLNVEVIDGIMKVWWSGHEEVAWTIDISEGYQAGYVSLYSGGNDQGGVKNFTVYEILDEDINANVDMNVEVIGEYTVVTVNNDIAGGVLKNSTLKGNLKFDSNKFEYSTTVIEDTLADRHDNVVPNVTEEGVPLDMTSYSANANAKFYFKNTTDELDFTGFAFDVESITRTNKETASATTTEAVKYDYTGTEGTSDKFVDVRDLVRAAKNDETPVDVRNALVGIHADNDWVTGVTGEVKDTIYVDATNGSYTGDGTAESPLNSLVLAGYRVAAEGTIHVVGTYTFDSTELAIGMGEKNITITGGDAVLDLTGISKLDVSGDVTLKNITVKADDDNIYANGHNFTVESSVAFDGKVSKIFGGNNGELPLETTNLNLQAGNYDIIYGGSHSVSTITGNTNVTIGGTVNNNHPDFNVSDHAYNEVVCAYAGSHNGLVKGNTNVTVEGSAKTSYVHGGGWGANSEVLGTCNVYANGGTLSGIYGGSLGGTVYSTNVVITGGTMEQVFGGSWVGSLSGVDAKITGTTNVTFTGGTVTRRIFGGCYNNESTDGNIVTGTTTLNIGGNANYDHSYGWLYDLVICAGSRYSSDSDAETSVMNITTDKYSSYSSYIDKSYGSSDTVNQVTTLP